ncbi:hypothetical protein BSKO_07026 [Bryopsis sp. KO-2023]|nr:hypothetical protein BSKO_07026 [Bryopsis sp. KO-2023]
MGQVPEIKDCCKEGNAGAVEICKKLLPDWETLSVGDVEVSTVSGGITNALLKVSPKADSGVSPVVVRIFGPFTELLVDREREARVLVQLNQAGFGAKVLGLFGNGRIEEYLDCKALEPTEMANPILTERIAQKLYEFHSVAVEGESKEPQLFSTARRMIKMAKELKFESESDRKAVEALDLDGVAKEVDRMEEICKTTGSPLVCSHNDLLSGNILLIRSPSDSTEGFDEASSPMNFIDFEYGTYSYRGFDLGNHFNEYAGFDCDWSLYPDTQQQKRFLSAYLHAKNGSDPSNGETVDERDVERLVAEADVFSLMSHVYWGVWSIIQAKYSSIDFDYLGYSKNRLDQYFARKPSVLKAAGKIFSIGAGD